MPGWVASAWCWLENLRGAAPVVVGSTVGATLGFISLVLGALFNARLNRLRDDRLLAEKKKSVSAALLAEIRILEQTLTGNNVTLSHTKSDSLLVSDPASIMKVFPRLLSDIHILDGDAVKEVSELHALLDQYAEGLIILGGNPVTFAPKGRLIIDFPGVKASELKRINESYIERCKKCEKRLSPEAPLST
jgi:hypothetical protein